MAEFDEDANKLTLKVVYYGPAQSGKTTNLSGLHELLSPQLKGDLMVLETKGDRTLFFDLLPIGVKCESGLLIKLKLFTVPGQVAHDSTRKAVLSRADGVAFIADSGLNQAQNNLVSFENLVANVSRVGLDIDDLPLIIQFNKRDLPNIVSGDEVISRWSQTPWPVNFASAIKNQGVSETFIELLGSVYDRLDEQFELCKAHHMSKQRFIKSLTAMS